MPPTSLDHRLAQTLKRVGPLQPLDVTLPESRGTVLAADVVAEQPWPAFATCAANGFAVRAADVRPGASLALIDPAVAGAQGALAIGPGKAIAVQAGAPLPGAADTILAPTMVGRSGDQLQVRTSAPQGSGITAAGSVAPVGKVLIPRGTLVDDRCIGVLAALGRSRVSVLPRPRVVMVSIGDSATERFGALETSKTDDAAGLLLVASAATQGGIPFRVGPISNEPTLVADTLDDQLVRADLIVVVGGSDGDGSPVQTALRQLGDVSFEPSPTNLPAFGMGTLGTESAEIIALPPDPVASYLLFQLLARPIIQKMLGAPPQKADSIRLGVDVPASPGHAQILLVNLDAAGRAVPMATRHPNLMDLQSADGMIQVQPGLSVQRRDSEVAIIRFANGPRGS
ncbi:MAG: hypothetical protein K0U64_09580 [Actinomycetia bacterium]|nr:hypothetical protein [Actinomycetes bacterium]